jgi:hypothetical protein
MAGHLIALDHLDNGDVPALTSLRWSAGSLEIGD